MADRSDRCPVCGGRLPNGAGYGKPGEPERLRDAVLESVAPVARASAVTVVAVTLALAVTAVGHVAFHRTAGSVLGGLVCLALAGAIWYGRRSPTRHRARR